MKIKVVAITGADDSINPSDLITISKEFPYVEWAILLSKNQVGSHRFPSKKWMEELVSLLESAQQPIKLAGHLCGSWLRQLMDIGDISFVDQIPLWPYLSRIQLNFHAKPTILTLPALEALRNFTWKYKKKFIVQLDGINNELCEQLVFAGVDASGLFDTSHGSGASPEKWPEVIPFIDKHAYKGYAGGLGPDNLQEELFKIQSAVGDDLIWIDMETKIRSNDEFDLDKVRKCLNIAYDFVLQDHC